MNDSDTNLTDKVIYIIIEEINQRQNIAINI